jgi:hypothetical protein
MEEVVGSIPTRSTNKHRKNKRFNSLYPVPGMTARPGMAGCRFQLDSILACRAGSADGAAGEAEEESSDEEKSEEGEDSDGDSQVEE